MSAASRFKLPEDGWFHLVPKGRFPVVDPEKPSRKIIQVVDDAALKSMLDRFKSESQQPNFPGLLVDYDHFSYDASGSSVASGWVSELQNRADGIWGKVRWTDSGEAKLRGGAFRFISPVFDKAGSQKLSETEFRPMRLDSLGLTNSPNLRGMVPLANSLRGVRSESSSEPFSVLLNRASDRIGDAARGLKLLQIEESTAYDATAPCDRINALVNRIRSEMGGTFQQAWYWASKIAPDEFGAADPQYLANKGKEQRSADERAYRVEVLANRNKISRAEAWALIGD